MIVNYCDILEKVNIYELYSHCTLNPPIYAIPFPHFGWHGKINTIL